MQSRFSKSNCRKLRRNGVIECDPIFNNDGVWSKAVKERPDCGLFPNLTHRAATPPNSMRYTLGGCPCQNPISGGAPISGRCPNNCSGSDREAPQDLWGQQTSVELGDSYKVGRLNRLTHRTLIRLRAETSMSKANPQQPELTGLRNKFTAARK